MYYKYIGSSFGGEGPIWNFFGIKEGQCPADDWPLPLWSGLAANHGASRGVMSGLPKSYDPREALPLGCFDYYDGDVPSPVSIPLADYKSKASSSRKDFEKAKAAGMIVVNAMVAETSSMTLIPGMHGDATSMGGDSLLAPRVDVPPTEPAPVNPCNGYTEPGYAYYTSMGGLPLDYKIRTSGRKSVVVWRLYERYSGAYPGLPPASIGREAYDAAHAILRGPRDSGLVTAVVAEANSGIVDLLTELGEAKETIGYIFGLLGSIVDLVVKTKRDVLRAKTRPGQSAKEIASEVASIWMQFRYAVSPIGYSVNDALDYLQSSFAPYQTFRRGNSTKLDVELSDGWVLKDFEFIDRVWLKYQYSLDTRTQGLKLNPFATAWELTPLSFVVDWVLNIGDLLSSLQTPSAVTQTACTYSRQVRGQTFMVRHESGRYGHIELDMRFYETQPINPLGQVGLNFNPSMTWKRWLDAISLSWLLTKDKLKSK